MVKAFIAGSFYPLIILAYHDLSRNGDFLSWMRVNVEDFERQIRLFKKIGNFIRPEDLYNPEKLKKNRLNILLTFDDGYSNCYYLGLPIIKKHDIPALFFVSTSNLQSREPFWFDKIIQPIQHNNIDCLDLSYFGLKKYRFTKSGNNARWNNLQTMLEDIKQADKDNYAHIIEDIICHVQSTFTQQDTRMNKDNFQPLCSRHIYEMYRSGLCYFGSHSHNHTIMTSLSDDELTVELAKSRMILEEIVGNDVHLISYPNGDADERVKEASRNAGYRYGFTINKVQAGYYPDEMYIPRVLIGGFDSVLVIMRKVVKRLLLLRTPAHNTTELLAKG